MIRHLFTLGVAYAASCPGYKASQCICEGDQGVGYEGTMDHSDKGIKCMDWKDAPNKRYRDKGLPANYCRNVNGYDGGVWCYTEGGSWGYCDVPTCDEISTTTTTTTNDNRIRVHYIHKGTYKDSDTYSGVGGVARTKEPLNDGEYVAVKVGDTWNKATPKGEGKNMKWEYIDWSDREVGTKVEIGMAIFNSDGQRTSPIQKSYTTGVGLNKVILTSQTQGVIADGKYSGITAKGKTAKRLQPGERLSIDLYGELSKIEFDEDGNWSFKDDTVRNVGEPVNVYVSIKTSKGQYATGAITLKFDGREYTNELEVVRYHTGWYGDGKKYRGLGAKVKPVKPLKEGESVRVRIDGGATGDGHWRNAEKKDDGIWEYSNWYWRTVGVKAKIEVAIFNEKKEQISPIVQTYADGTGLNKFKTLKTQKIAVRTDDTYSGISASGNTVLPLLPGEHVVLKLDGKKRNIEIDRAGNWEFRDDTVRKMGEKVNVRVSIYDKNGRETTAGWNMYYTGK